MGILTTHYVTIQHSNGTIVTLAPLPVTMTPVNNEWITQVHGTIPVDEWKVSTIGWATPVPLRSDYLVDETGKKYSMYSSVLIGQNNLQFRVSSYSGTTP